MKDSVLSCLGIVTLFVGVMVFGSIIHGIVLAVMWGWFVVPLFGLPALSIAQAIGLGMTILMFSGNGTAAKTNNEDRDEAIVGIINGVLVTPLLVLLVGWIVHLFV